MHRSPKPVAFALVAAALLLAAAPAGAIHDGVPDGNAHPDASAMASATTNGSRSCTQASAAAS